MRFKKVLMIDSLSTIHVGNGALLDNTYKLCKDFIANDVEVITADIKPNISRFPVLMEDIFSDYAGSIFKKLRFSIKLMFFYIVEFMNAIFFRGSLQFPWSKRFRDLINAIERSDVVVSLSGETINDHYYPQMYQRLLTYHLAIIRGKKLILFPQSIGPIYKPLSKFLLRVFLGKAQVIIARDSRSTETARKLWGGNKVKLLFCPDVAVTQVSEPVVLPGIVVDKKVIGLTVSEIPKDEMGYDKNYLPILVEKIALFFDAESYQILLMPSNYQHDGVSADYRLSLEARSQLIAKGYNVAILPNKIIHPDVYQGMQKNLFIFISTRMHVGILATSACVPTIMINTQHKIRAYMDLIGMERFVVELDEFDLLINKFEALIEQHDVVQKKLACENSKLRDLVVKTISSLF